MPTPPVGPPGGQSRGRRPSRKPCPRVAGPPLPDPAAVRLHTVPDSAPPYDDELAAASGPAQPGGRPARDAPRPATVGHPAGGRVPGVAGGGEPALPSQFARVLVETLAGTRPPRQLTSWTTERARSRIQRMGPLLTAGQPARLRRVVARHPAADVIEMTVLLSVGPQIRALAVRLEHTAPRPASLGRPTRPGRWLCTQVEAA
jgi:Family of unknown function (DUF6459)